MVYVCVEYPIGNCITKISVCSISYTVIVQCETTSEVFQSNAIQTLKTTPAPAINAAIPAAAVFIGAAAPV